MVNYQQVNFEIGIFFSRTSRLSVGIQMYFSYVDKVISNLTEEIQVSRRASDQGSYAKPLLVQALSSHLRV